MQAELDRVTIDPPDEEVGVSDRLMSELFRALDRHGIAPTRLIGDLPIPVDESGRVMKRVGWAAFCEFLRRLEPEVGGSDGLEQCGEWLIGSPGDGQRRGLAGLRGLVAVATSPASLYKATGRNALPRAIPGIDVEIAVGRANRLSVQLRLADSMRACPQLFPLLTGATRALPRLLGLPDAVVDVKAEERRARFDVHVPASRTAVARIFRFLRAIFSPGSVFRYFEDKQLELHARLARLARVHESVLASERRLRALSDATVDVLCEIDADGRIVFASPSVAELMGYSRNQVMGSHYRLWIPADRQASVRRQFEALRDAPIGTALTRGPIELHAAHGRRVAAEISVRSHLGADGDWRAVVVMRRARMRGPAARERETASDRPSEIARDVLRLRERSTRLASRSPGHPLARSLPRLLAQLEAFERAGRPDAERRTLPSTQRMARIVEQTLLHEHVDQSAGQWLETRKVVGRVRDAFASRPCERAIRLRLDLAQGPGELWGREALLDACIAGLVDWADERARVRGAESFVLSISREAPRAPRPVDVGDGAAPTDATVRIAVSLDADPGAAAPSGAAADAALLALAVAEDAARALGGELLPACSLDRVESRVVRLPQPVPADRPAGTAQSGSRSMSAPSARSFSSIRS
jgi:PAS domain S-box-containing protein